MTTAKKFEGSQRYYRDALPKKDFDVSLHIGLDDYVIRKFELHSISDAKKCRSRDQGKVLAVYEQQLQS